MSVASHFFITWEAKINRYAITYLHLFPFCNTYLIHLIFIGMETTQHKRKVIEGPFKHLQIKFFAKVVHVHMKLENNTSE